MVNNLQNQDAPLPPLKRPFILDPADNFGYPRILEGDTRRFAHFLEHII
ncbi:MAG TPA: hypothetical protein VKM55_26960 [Candidatus Lokiarchaeia archaeon]|nr:hypothetical protein [Candidatus Lokiarchaeia archaeon]